MGIISVNKYYIRILKEQKVNVLIKNTDLYKIFTSQKDFFVLECIEQFRWVPISTPFCNLKKWVVGSEDRKKVRSNATTKIRPGNKHPGGLLLTRFCFLEFWCSGLGASSRDMTKVPMKI